MRSCGVGAAVQLAGHKHCTSDVGHVLLVRLQQCVLGLFCKLCAGPAHAAHIRLNVLLFLVQKELDQPVSYLKEVLNEVASQVKRGPNKDLWELKKHLITGSTAPQQPGQA
eukprot:GHRQ01029145.1.p2 GENE.GHRQ01029145.1~~GHRQ01029145.1.p2  ORF type:complete len:111 (+),score=41.79 GHRQ01029145.1:572-904(+)